MKRATKKYAYIDLKNTKLFVNKGQIDQPGKKMCK